MIEVACKDIDENTKFTRIFSQCVQDASVDTSSAVVSRLYSELSKKKFHVKVNEFITPSIELNLEVERL